jgi:hypothetical protein
MTDVEGDQDHEELAHIPWSMLADELDGGRSRTMVALVLAVIAAVVVGVVGVRALRRTPGTVVDLSSEPPVTAAASPSPPVPATLPPAETPAAPAEPDGPALYAEADLMAVAPEQDQRRAAAGAEWFVVDSFTIDDVAQDEPAMWVEWARATEVVSTGPSTYDVVVVFSTLGRDAAGAYVRAGLRAVRVQVAITPDGLAVPEDYPEPLPLASPPVLSPPPPGDAAVPDEVVAAATDAAAGFGSAPEVIAGSPTEDGWRVVLSVVDPSGIELRLVVHVDG